MTLFPTILLLCGKVNFTNMSRYSDLSEKTYRRHYSQGSLGYSFAQINRGYIEASMPNSANCLGLMDCSFVPKSGKGTSGLDWFYNGTASRSEKGLEISVFAVVDVETHRAFTLSVQQTPADPRPWAQRPKKSSKQKTKSQKCRMDLAVIEQLRCELEQLPAKPPVVSLPSPPVMEEPTRIDHYLAHLNRTYPDLPVGLKYLVVDGFYTKQKFVDGVCDKGLHLVGKLRKDANLRYLYEGPQKARGCPRKYDGKVYFSDLRRFTRVAEVAANLTLYSAVVWHVSLKRKIRVACLVDTRKPDTTGLLLLFSTDVDLDAQQILTNYQARFQIEFIFRDAKQFTGLCDCQSRDAQKLDFHFNAALTALNIARYEAQLQSSDSDPSQKPIPFSMASYKRAAFNDHLLERFISKLDLDPSLIKSHPNYQDLRSYGILAA